MICVVYLGGAIIGFIFFCGNKEKELCIEPPSQEKWQDEPTWRNHFHYVFDITRAFAITVCIFIFIL